jgi:hypothetical protein
LFSFFSVLMAVPEPWGMTIVGTDTFLESLESLVLRLAHGLETCKVMMTDYAEGTMACLVGLLRIKRSGVGRVGAAAGNILSLFTRMSFVYEAVVATDGAITGATFTTWVEPPDPDVWAVYLTKLSVFAAHLHDVMAPLLEAARGVVPTGGGRFQRPAWRPPSTPIWALALAGALVALVERVVASAICSHRDYRFRTNGRHLPDFKALSFHHKPRTLRVRPVYRSVREGVDTGNLYGVRLGVCSLRVITSGGMVNYCK